MGDYAIMSAPGVLARLLLFWATPALLVFFGFWEAKRSERGSRRRIGFLVLAIGGMLLFLYVPIVLLYNFAILTWLDN